MTAARVLLAVAAAATLLGLAASWADPGAPEIDFVGPLPDRSGWSVLGWQDVALAALAAGWTALAVAVAAARRVVPRVVAAGAAVASLAGVPLVLSADVEQERFGVPQAATATGPALVLLGVLLAVAGLVLLARGGRRAAGAGDPGAGVRAGAAVAAFLLGLSLAEPSALVPGGSGLAAVPATALVVVLLVLASGPWAPWRVTATRVLVLVVLALAAATVVRELADAEVGGVSTTGLLLALGAVAATAATGALRPRPALAVAAPLLLLAPFLAWRAAAVGSWTSYAPIDGSTGFSDVPPAPDAMTGWADAPWVAAAVVAGALACAALAARGRPARRSVRIAGAAVALAGAVALAATLLEVSEQAFSTPTATGGFRVAPGPGAALAAAALGLGAVALLVRRRGPAPPASRHALLAVAAAIALAPLATWARLEGVPPRALDDAPRLTGVGGWYEHRLLALVLLLLAGSLAVVAVRKAAPRPVALGLAAALVAAAVPAVVAGLAPRGDEIAADGVVVTTPAPFVAAAALLAGAALLAVRPPRRAGPAGPV